MVHRDVKPANILIDHDGRAHLSDFGVARLSGESGLTMTGGVVGTVAYMSPEQARGAPVGPESDVYSASLVVYEGLAGRNPVSASSPAETARRAAAGGLPPLASLRPELPPDLCRAIDAGLRRDPEARPDAAEMADALSGARGGVRAARRRGTRALPGGRLRRRGREPARGSPSPWRTVPSTTRPAWTGARRPSPPRSRPSPRWPSRGAPAGRPLCAVVAGAVLVGLSAPARRA